MIVTNVGRDAVARERRTAPVAYGKIVWFWRPDAGVKFCGKARGAMVARKPVTKESAL
jgi:hypothetical protein